MIPYVITLYPECAYLNIIRREHGKDKSYLCSGGNLAKVVSFAVVVFWCCTLH